MKDANDFMTGKGEPAWSLPMNRAELIARCEDLAAQLRALKGVTVNESAKAYGEELARQMTAATGIALEYCPAHGILKPPCWQCAANVKPGNSIFSAEP
jgi:hypothetical protein